MSGQIVAKSSSMMGSVQMIFLGLQKGDPQYCDYVAPITFTTPLVTVTLTDNYPSDSVDVLRVVLIPTTSSDLCALLDQVQSLGDSVKQSCLGKGFVTEVSQWKEPVKETKGIITGLLAKVKRSSVVGAFLLQNMDSPVIMTLKVGCAYFTADRAGLSLQVLGVQDVSL